MKAHLLEVNQNPSLATDTILDQTLKVALIRNIFDIVARSAPLSFEESQ